ncbi:zinc ribbon domain-containing protein [Mucilaginibacter rubeus]|uniref:zinc ribbon domain-containing protein n=1 Tax=Mucilaginibacter rubeus TaxID=2027860 RepID=UPI0016676F2A|nr:zinc ribbon domain-containing protein [Mucilaginibacter rubeus]GGA98904.1 hypothetical protein GCM10011500_13440 [Mucilaginibacter rubeus]
MESLNCFNCDTSVVETDNFCAKCGKGLKCKSCKTFIKKDAEFCFNCGGAFYDTKSTEHSPLNTIKYRKSDAEISCEISFTDNVGKERMNDLLSAIVNNRSGMLGNQNGSQLNNRLKIGDENDTYELNDHEELHTSISSNNPSEESNEIPHLNDIASKIECSENSWIGIHAFYISEFGAKNFDKDTVRNAYMERRKTDSRSSNFSKEWQKAHQKYFKTIRDNEFNFQNGAIAEIENIILEKKNKTTSKTKKKTAATGSKKTPSRSIAIEEFDLSKGVNPAKPSLEEFMSIKKPGNSTYDRIVVIAYYITRLNKNEHFTEGQVEFAYKALQLSDRPGHLRQTINNIKNTKVWFKDVSQGQWTLERIGEIYVDEKLPSKEVNSQNII